MNEQEIKQLVQNGESSNVEFKTEDVHPISLAGEIVAFANFEGGIILVGVNDDGGITGCKRKDVEEFIINVCRNNVRPALIPVIERIIDNQVVYAVTIDKEYRPYWWSTGNPSFLIDLLKEQRRYLPDLENFIADDIVLDTFDVDHIDLVALLWQTGYLTFADKLERFGSVAYKMKIPNLEIQVSLNALFIDYLTDHEQGQGRYDHNPA